MSRFISTMTLTIFILLCTSEVLLRPVKPTYAEELDKYKQIRMKMLNIEVKNHVQDSQKQRTDMQKEYSLPFNLDINEIDNDITNNMMNYDGYNTDATEDSFGTKSYEGTETVELPSNIATSTDTGEMKAVEKRLFSAFSRLKSLADMYRELQERGRHHRVYIFRDGDNQPSLRRSPGAPLRWG